MKTDNTTPMEDKHTPEQGEPKENRITEKEMMPSSDYNEGWNDAILTVSKLLEHNPDASLRESILKFYKQ
jgi:hypothetical protein